MKDYLMWFTLIVVLIFVLSSCNPTGAQHSFYETPQPTEARQIGNTTLKLREYWRVSQIYVGGSFDSHLLAVRGQVLCTSYDFANKITRLLAFDATKGNLQWEAKGKPGGSELATDVEQVYFINPFEIRAYALEGGQQLWTTQVLPHRAYRLYSDGERLYVRDQTHWEVYYLDVQTGDKLGESSLLTGDEFILLARTSWVDLYTNRTQLKAVDANSQQLLWLTDIGNIGPIRNRPVLFNDILLVGVQEPVFAIDLQTGYVKWNNKGKPFASNFVVADGFVYALDHDARLVQWDVQTGQETGYLQFTPAQVNTVENRYWVATDGQMLFVSFDDSQELIALGP